MTSSDVASLGPHPKDQPAAGDLQSLARPRDRRRTGASLRSRALRLLARREYTRAELRRRLLLAEESDVRKSLQQSGGPDPDALEPITDELLERIETSVGRTGERVWRLPLPDDMRPQLDSKVADLKNIGAGRYGGASIAGLTTFGNATISPVVSSL